MESGAEYGFRGRLVWKKFVSAEDCVNEYEQWFAAAPNAWLKVKGQFDPKIARRILEEQGQTKLIALMEKAGAL